MGVLVALIKMIEVMVVKKIQITKNLMCKNFKEIQAGMTHIPSIVTNFCLNYYWLKKIKMSRFFKLYLGLLPERILNDEFSIKQEQTEKQLKKPTK